MTRSMFCPKCGAGARSVDSYCTRGGQWMPDIDALNRPGVFRKWSREQKLRKMRVLEALSAVLSLASAAAIIFVLSGWAGTQLLILAAFLCFIVAAYQVINFYLDHKLQRRVSQSRAGGTGPIKAAAENDARPLGAGGATPFVGGGSVVEETTKLLEPVPRKSRRGQ